MPEISRSLASVERLAVARLFSDAYAAEPSIVAVVCAGSTGRGDADRWSDLELLVVWKEVPAEELRRAIPLRIGGQDPRLWTWNSHDRASYDDWWYGGPAGQGLLLEITHTTSADLATHIDALATGEADLSTITLGDAIVHGVLLVDRGGVATWSARLVPYPRPLAVAVVQRYGQIDHFWRWRKDVERNNLLQLQGYFADVATRIVQVNCALSGMWWPGAKWLLPIAARLPIAPENLANRLELLAQAAPMEAAEILEGLVDESYDLVAKHLPEVDVARLRAIFHFTRSAWPAQP